LNSKIIIYHAERSDTGERGQNTDFPRFCKINILLKTRYYKN